jgi:hypothetical protein
VSRQLREPVPEGDEQDSYQWQDKKKSDEVESRAPPLPAHFQQVILIPFPVKALFKDLLVGDELQVLPDGIADRP